MERLTIALVGHASSGKTLVGGRLRYHCAGVHRQVRDLLDAEAAAAHNPLLRFYSAAMQYITSWDGVRDVHLRVQYPEPTASLGFARIRTGKYFVTLVDTPGARSLIGTAIRGLSQADVAILVVNALPGEFEAGLAPRGQTREHILLARALGVSLVVAVTMLGDARIADQAARYAFVRENVGYWIARVGGGGGAAAAAQVAFVPLADSAVADNVRELSPATEWYGGPTLVAAIDAVALKPARRAAEAPLRIPVHSVFKIGGIGTVAVGRVESGAVAVGMTLCFAPRGHTAVVKSLERFHEPCDAAQAGDNVAFCLKNTAVRDVDRGMVASDASALEPAAAAGSFLATLVIISHPGVIRAGYCPLVFCHTAHAACRFVELVSKLDRRSGAVVEHAPRSVKTGDTCVARLAPCKPLCVEPASRCSGLGRIVIRDLQTTVAVGVVTEVAQSCAPSALTKSAAKLV